MTVQSVPSPLAGFENVSIASNHVFRGVLDAFSRPGKLVPLAMDLPTPAEINGTAMSVLLAMADLETPVFIAADLQSDQLTAHLQFHTGCPITSKPSDAAFALASAHSDLSFLDQLAVGDAENPHASTTLILMVDGFQGSEPITLSGPGIEEKAILTAEQLPGNLIQKLKRNHQLFPCGFDVILAASQEIAGLPRSTKLEA
ncbi:phosphonate C-P lyase system protein PhnH [Sneathiella limimaris]|uniref:phosphonate C-P lyase system protein PhnH n=1 Tax=Sneathiella limimaris TaxID=1964213 RepID=UPI00146D7AD9|nr:phosphonate C-P lyase system protein PhnH [Sneathiella limimaris]